MGNINSPRLDGPRQSDQHSRPFHLPCSICQLVHKSILPLFDSHVTLKTLTFKFFAQNYSWKHFSKFSHYTAFRINILTKLKIEPTCFDSFLHFILPTVHLSSVYFLHLLSYTLSQLRPLLEGRVSTVRELLEKYIVRFPSVLMQSVLLQPMSPLFFVRQTWQHIMRSANSYSAVITGSVRFHVIQKLKNYVKRSVEGLWFL